MNMKYVIIKFKDLRDDDKLVISVEKNNKPLVSFSADPRKLPNKNDFLAYFSQDEDIKEDIEVLNKLEK